MSMIPTVPARPATRPRLTIRRMMVANLFVAVALAEIAVAARQPDRLRALCLFVILPPVIPLTWGSLASLAMRPGPGRDLFIAVMILIPSVLLTGFFFALPWLLGPTPAARFFVALGVLGTIGTVAMVALMSSGPCPACGRRGLVRSRQGPRPGRSFLHRYGWCLRCDARLKQRRLARGRGPWVDASAPEDDIGYDLWTPAVALGTLRDRLRRRSP